MQDIVTLDYGSGGKTTSSFIDEIILPAFDNETLSELGDAAALSGAERLTYSTDSFVVSPYFFPGGDIGKLSVCGTVNDIAMGGGTPKYLSLSLILEEGLPLADLKTIINSIKVTAKKAGVQIVTGDTKVVERGHGDGIYINTSGIGIEQLHGLSPKRIKPGDKVIVSGTVGDHGTAIMLARDKMFEGSGIVSDCAPLCSLAAKLYTLGENLRVLRDPTRGGIATTLCEFVDGTENCIELNEASIPVAPQVKSACDMLGLDPMYCANEGKLLAVVSPERAEEALALLKSDELGINAAIIGEITANHPGRVVMKTAFGGSRIITKLAGAQLPRIC